MNHHLTTDEQTDRIWRHLSWDHDLPLRWIQLDLPVSLLHRFAHNRDGIPLHDSWDATDHVMSGQVGR